MKERARVIFFNASKGWGFLKRKQGGDIFVHWSGILAEGYKTLNPDDEVEFEIEIGPKGKPQAVNVSVVSPIARAAGAK